MTTQGVQLDFPPYGGQRFSVTLEPVPESSWRARTFVRSVLDDSRWDPVRDTALLLTSELVTNAMLHTATPAEVVVEIDEGVTISVRDSGTGPLLAARVAGEVDGGGRGLILVDRLADKWGTEHARGHKVVWFHLAAQAPGSALPEGPPRREEPSWSPSEAAQSVDRRLASLMLDERLEGHLTSRQRLAEILARTCTALDAAGALLDLDPSIDEPMTMGTPEGVPHQSPLRLGGHSYGTLVVFARQPFGEEEQALLRVAAQWLALNLVSGQLSTNVGKRQSDLAFLGEATELLANAVHLDHVLSVTVQLAVASLAEWAAAFVVDDRGRHRQVTALHTNENHLDALLAVLAVAPALSEVLTRSVQRGEPVPVTDGITVGEQRYQALAFPLPSRQAPSAVLLLGTLDGPDHGADLAAIELSRRAGLALDKATLHEEVADAAKALQDSLLPARLPVLPALRVAVRYEAATRAISIGGDFWDGYELDDGTAVVCIGDVCGKGPAAGALARTSRDILRVLLEEGWKVGEALARLNRALRGLTDDDRFCTMAIAAARQDGEGSKLRLTLAGHPLPILVRGPGRAAPVGLTGSLLGVLPDRDFQVREVELRLEPGDSLVLYTDGVTEARRGDEVFGVDRLTSLLGRASRSAPGELAEAVYRAAADFTVNGLRDDVAVLVARPAPPAPQGSA